MHTFKALLQTVWTTDKNETLFVESHGADLEELLENYRLSSLGEDGKLRFYGDATGSPTIDKVCVKMITSWFNSEYERWLDMNPEMEDKR